MIYEAMTPPPWESLWNELSAKWSNVALCRTRSNMLTIKVPNASRKIQMCVWTWANNMDRRYALFILAISVASCLIYSVTLLSIIPVKNVREKNRVNITGVNCSLSTHIGWKIAFSRMFEGKQESVCCALLLGKWGPDSESRYYWSSNESSRI